jgi:hypothetical protein
LAAAIAWNAGRYSRSHKYTNHLGYVLVLQ